MTALANTDLPGLKLLSKGKVRDVYETSSPGHLLFVATDRVSVFDVILRTGIPDKGKLLTEMSLFWFSKLSYIIPNHFVTASIDEMSEDVKQYREQLDGRTMLVKKAKVLPIEAIVRGYITGSAWSEYKRKGTVHGITVPTGLVEAQKLQEPIFTPSTKAEQGLHDANISPERAAQILGQELYDKVERVSLDLYKAAAEYAESKGILIADTKFEFGILPESGELILVDEVLTPDSSRYWPKDSYAPGSPPPSFDKQYLRDWLVSVGYRPGLESGKEGHEGEGWSIDESVVQGTRDRYVEVVRRLTKP